MPEGLTVDNALRAAEEIADMPLGIKRGTYQRDLWQDVLRAIADGHPQSAKLAAAALKTRDRWHDES